MMTRTTQIFAGSALAAITLALAAPATASPAYLKIGDIKGETTERQATPPAGEVAAPSDPQEGNLDRDIIRRVVREPKPKPQKDESNAPERGVTTDEDGSTALLLPAVQKTRGVILTSTQGPYQKK